MEKIPDYKIKLEVIVCADNPRQAAERIALSEQRAAYWGISNIHPPELIEGSQPRGVSKDEVWTSFQQDNIKTDCLEYNICIENNPQLICGDCDNYKSGRVHEEVRNE